MGFEIGLILACVVVACEDALHDAIGLVVLCTIMGIMATYLNQCAEKSEEDYFDYPTTYQYYQATNGRTVLKKTCDIENDVGKLRVEVAGANGIVDDFETPRFSVRRRFGIDDAIVDLSSNTIRVPYKND